MKNFCAVSALGVFLLLSACAGGPRLSEKITDDWVQRSSVSEGKVYVFRQLPLGSNLFYGLKFQDRIAHVSSLVEYTVDGRRFEYQPLRVPIFWVVKSDSLGHITWCDSTNTLGVKRGIQRAKKLWKEQTRK